MIEPIRKRPVGRSSLSLSVFGLGGTGLGNMYRAVEDRAALNLVAAAYSSGIRYFDTAPVYGFGLSESRLGQSLAGLPREQIVVSTKVGYRLVPLRSGEGSWALWDQTPPYRTEYDFSREATLRSLEGSLERLRLDRLDMVAIHDPDEAMGIDAAADPYAKSHFAEAMDGAYRALHDLRSQGAIGAIGVGINQWQMLVDFAKEGEFDYFLLAGRYTLLEQQALVTLLPLCLQRGISLVVGGPYNSGILASGAVAGAYYNYAPAAPEILERVRRIEAICESFKVPLRAAALQFPLGHPAVAAVIPGARSTRELDENLAAFRESIPEGLWATLKEEKLIEPAAPVPTGNGA